MIKIAFYKGEGTLINRIVRRWTSSPYSHAELVMPDNKTWIGISPFLNSEVSARNVLKDPNLNLEDWDFLNFDVTDEQASIIMEFYEQTKGNRYDWIGMLLSQVGPFVIKQEKKWFEKHPLLLERIELLERDSHAPCPLEEFDAYPALIRRIEELENKVK